MNIKRIFIVYISIQIENKKKIQISRQLVR